MNKKHIKRNIVLGVLFFLPVTFLLFLFPAKHNYNPLDIINENVFELNNFTSDFSANVILNNHITVLGFLGNNPENKIITSSNINELVYKKFKGFKTFQVVIVVPNSAKEAAQRLRMELSKYDELKYWHFIFAEEQYIKLLYSSLITSTQLDDNLATDYIFIVDRELNQRGRLDDRTDSEINKNSTIYTLPSYNSSKVAILKNKMSEDMRVLFTEYRQKRKGNFDSTIKKANNLK